MAVGGWREPHSDSDSSADGEDEEDGKLKELVSNVCCLFYGVCIGAGRMEERWQVGCRQDGGGCNVDGLQCC